MTDPDNSNSILWNDYLDSNVLETLSTLTPMEAQMAVVNRMYELVTSKNVDNLSSSLSGIIRSIKKYGYNDVVDEETNNVPTSANAASKDKVTNTTKTNTMPKEEDIIEEENDDDEDNNEERLSVLDDTAELSKFTG